MTSKFMRTATKTACVAVLLMVAMAMVLPAEVSVAKVKVPTQVKDVKVIEYTKNLKVVWKKISGVKGYPVYRAVSAKGNLY